MSNWTERQVCNASFSSILFKTVLNINGFTFPNRRHIYP